MHVYICTRKYGVEVELILIEAITSELKREAEVELAMERKLLVMVVGIVVLMQLREGRAEQEDERWCINKLLPCLSFLNGTRNPPDSCCDPLKSVIKSDPECLCKMISNEGTKQAQNAGINVNEAQQLPGRCGQHVNPISCLTSGAASPNSRKSVPNGAYGRPTPTSSMTTMTMMLIVWFGAFLYCT